MSIYNLIPQKVITKTPHALAWLAQALFAAALPDVFEKMPKQMMLAYIGLTPGNLNRLKYFTPALVATLTSYAHQLLVNINSITFNRQEGLKCCTGH